MKLIFVALMLSGLTAVASLTGLISRDTPLAGEAASENQSIKHYLALGDSYTIGQSVPAEENFPNQLAASLRNSGVQVEDVEIRAVTGWTTADLIASLEKAPPARTHYDLVTLLIGVNNQFRGGELAAYESEFTVLLKEAIRLAGDKKKVIVISTPDYSVTPFAEGSDRRKIAAEITLFNTAQQKIALAAGVYFVDITPLSRRGEKDASLQAEDGLHPSGKQYAQWDELLFPIARKILQ